MACSEVSSQGIFLTKYTKPNAPTFYYGAIVTHQNCGRNVLQFHHHFCRILDFTSRDRELLFHPVFLHTSENRSN